jgi:hypothetical protein
VAQRDNATEPAERLGHGEHREEHEERSPGLDARARILRPNLGTKM